MDHYADAQMHTSSPGGADSRRGSNQRMLSDDSMHEARDSESVTEVLLPQMSVAESQRVAQLWHDEREKVAQVLWVEVPRPGHIFPPGRSKLSVICSAAWSMTKSAVPIIEWLPKMRLDELRADIIAGLTVGVMLIPQSMSYAHIAGLDYRYGMYSGLVPLAVYACTGTSRQLAVGPVAMVSLLVEVMLRDKLTEEECPKPLDWVSEQQWEYCPDQYAELAFLAAFLVGLFQIGAGFLQLGFLVSFLAHPVVSGFTSGAAITIGLSQVQYFMGYKIAKSPYIYVTLINLFKDIHKTDYITLLLGLGWWFMLWASRKFAAKYKRRLGWLRPCAPLIVCTLGIMIAANWNHFGGCGFVRCEGEDGENDSRVVGDIPKGFPPFSVFRFEKLGRVLPTAISASIIGYMESIAIAKSLAAKHKYEVYPGQELFALGLANLLGSLTSCYPITGSFSRSAVNNSVGARTPLAGLFTAALMLLTLVALTPYFYFLPLFCLAAIVISSVTNLVDIAEARYLWRVKKSDFVLWIVAFLGTLFLGVQEAILMAVGVSLFVVIYESVRPQMVVLWRLPGTPIYRNIKQDSIGQFVDGVLIVRIGASMYFANVAFIRDKLKELVFTFYKDAPKANQLVRYIVIECTAVISLDSTAIHMIEGLHREFKERGIRVAFATVGNRMDKDLRRAGLIDKIGARWFHPSVHSAVKFCTSHRAINRGNSFSEDLAPQEDEEDKMPSSFREVVKLNMDDSYSSRRAPSRTAPDDYEFNMDGAALGTEPATTELAALDPLADPHLDGVGVPVRRVNGGGNASSSTSRQAGAPGVENEGDSTNRV